MTIIKELEAWFRTEASKVATIVEREDHAIEVKSSQVYHEAQNIIAKIDECIKSSPAGEDVAVFADRIKAML